MFNFKAWLRGLKNQQESRHSDDIAVVSPVPSSVSGCPADDHNEFALDLYERLSQRPGNVFFSPFSVRVACAMAYAGARGETAAQMSSALHLSSTDESNQAGIVDLIQRLGADSEEYEMTSANALWSQAGESLESGFVELISRLYAGRVHTADFRGGNFEAARVDINRWVAKKTNHRIRNLIPDGGMNIDTRLALVNAVYFKGSWLDPFRKDATCDELFYPEDGAPVQAPFMCKETHLRYVQARGFQAAELDYKGGDLSMLVLLPEKNKRREFEAKLSTSFLNNCVGMLSRCEVELYLPRFKMTRETELGSQLSALGMPLAFKRGSADFSGINGHEPSHEESLFVSAVFHQAMVEVNEEGTEAAAATAVALTAFSMPYKPQPVPVFRADRPFLFAIRDKKSGAILFLGRVDDPTRES